MSETQIILSFLMGVGLASACGLRVFVPLLVTSVAGLTGWLPLGEGFAWLGSWPAVILLATATVVEIASFHIPWLDNLLDAATAPAAAVAGTLVMASSLTEADPLLQWSLAVIAGGGAATSVHALGAATRGASSVLTGGVMNPILSSLESAASFLLSVLAVLLPVLAAVLAILLIVVIWRFGRRFRRWRTESGGGERSLPDAPRRAT